MNNWHTEFIAEYNRQRILEEVEKIRLEHLATRSRAYRPGLFEQTMFHFANWMISTGNRLRKRYETPTVRCRQSPTRSYAP